MKLLAVALSLAVLVMMSPEAKAQTYSKNETIEYHDDNSLWVRDQVQRTTVNGTEVSRVEYSWKALPWKTYSFGKLQQTLSYDSTSTVASGQLGTLKTVADGNNNVTTLSSWKRGAPRSIVYPPTPESPSGASKTAVVNDHGSVRSVTDENGFTTSYDYDVVGRLDRIVYPTGDTTGWNDTTFTWEYRNIAEHGLPAGHWLRSQITGNGYKNMFFDVLWRPVLIHEFDAANISGTLRATSTAYDSSGHVVFQSYPSSDTIPAALGSWTSYDALDRVLTVKQDSELGQQLTTTTEYLPGFQTRVTNPRNQQTTNGYQAYDIPSYDLLRWSVQPEGKVIEVYRHPQLGAPEELRQRSNDGTLMQSRFYVYDQYRQLCKTVEPETGATIMDYDGAGNLQWSAAGTALTSRGGCDTIAGRDSGRKVTRYYDARNRLTQLLFPDGMGNQAWAYTPDGLPATILTFNNNTSVNNGEQVGNTYSYNKRRLLTAETVGQLNWYTWPLGYGYDANGSLSAQTFPDGASKVLYAPNALGQATSVSDIAGNVYAAGVQYYPNGAVKQFTYGNGVQHSMQQNARQLPARATDSGTTDFTFAYDANGNTTTIRDVNAPPNVYTGNRDLVYDGLDRLTSAHLHWHQVNTFGYDALDNIVAKSHFNGSTTVNHLYVYDARNQLVNVKDADTSATVVGLGYDDQGNLRNRNGQNYAFDYGNRLREVSGKEYYRYDGMGRRIMAWEPTTSSIFSQYTQSGQIPYQEDYRKGVILYNIYLAGSLVAVREKALATGVVVTKYQHTDPLGSPIAVTDQSATVIDRTLWEPYGTAINKPTYSGIGYTGHVMDSATGLTYMQQRYYDPSIGRFLSVDPVTANGNTGANFNRYWYANNNPYRFIDPDGRVVTSVENGEIRGPDTAVTLVPVVVRPARTETTAIVVHRTVSNSADSAIRSATNNGGKASFHIVIDTDGSTTQIANLDNVTNHVGKPTGTVSNRNSIGIEVVGNYNAQTKTWDPLTAAQTEATAYAIDVIGRAYGISPGSVFGHESVSRKTAGEGGVVLQSVDSRLNSLRLSPYNWVPLPP